MGLDMFVYSVPENMTDDTEVECKVPHDSDHLWSWRKFNNLHGWMRRLYLKKGGGDPHFNGNTVRLTHTDITALEEDAIRLDIPPESGFFFGGQDEFTSDDRDAVLEFCTEARSELSSGKAVIYTSSW